MKNPAAAYRQTAINSATPLGLVLMLYDAAVTSLDRAIQAVQAGQIEARTKAINRILGVVGELESALKVDQGGEVAKILQDFYAYARIQAITAAAENSDVKLQQLRGHFSTLREAWQQVEQTPAAGAPAPPKAPAAEPSPFQSQPMAPPDDHRPSRWSA